ncbi:hypothetical protein AOLI_G00154030 [Acnodon oligacanthus]
MYCGSGENTFKTSSLWLVKEDAGLQAKGMPERVRGEGILGKPMLSKPSWMSRQQESCLDKGAVITGTRLSSEKVRSLDMLSQSSAISAGSNARAAVPRRRFIDRAGTSPTSGLYLLTNEGGRRAAEAKLLSTGKKNHGTQFPIEFLIMTTAPSSLGHEIRAMNTTGDCF